MQNLEIYKIKIFKSYKFKDLRICESTQYT